jgi:hypothetical protein
MTEFAKVDDLRHLNAIDDIAAYRVTGETPAQDRRYRLAKQAFFKNLSFLGVLGVLGFLGVLGEKLFSCL